MLHFSKWKIISICLTLLLGLMFALPNVIGEPGREKLPGFMPTSTLNLGLDLQGGAHLLLETDLEQVLGLELERLDNAVRDKLSDRENRVRTRKVTQNVKERSITVSLRDAADSDRAEAVLNTMIEPIEAGSLTGGNNLTVRRAGSGLFELQYTEDKVTAIIEETIEKTRTVLRNRIDPTGTREMTIAKEGDDRILLQIPGVDAAELAIIKERINKTANLAFHMVDPSTDDAETMRLVSEGSNPPIGTLFFKGATLGEESGPTMIVERRTVVTGEELVKANDGVHPTQQNQRVVNFEFNISGARKFGRVTADPDNLGRRFAIVLDNQIISAPRINTPILGGKGYIEGNFTQQSAGELSLLLNAGALPAKLKIVEERTVGAELGADSIRAGKVALILGMIGVVAFMWLAYGFRFGTFANLALAFNIILIVAALSFLGATLTLPGIAGIILTIGMAVDANVLIFERIREEQANGRPPINAIDTGYRLSLAPILDANVTTLIAAVTLYFVGSGPVRGFAVTLAIGIVMSVFTAVVVARLITSVWLRRSRPKTLPI